MQNNESMRQLFNEYCQNYKNMEKRKDELKQALLVARGSKARQQVSWRIACLEDELYETDLCLISMGRYL